MRDDRAFDFSLFVGDNSAGKSTLLRSIALGMADETAASGLMSQWPGELLRNGRQDGRIRIELVESRASEAHWLETRVHRNRRKGIVELEQTSSPDFPREKLFVCGYGTARHGFGNRGYPRYSVEDATSTLFDYDQTLQNPELALSRMERQGFPMDLLTQRVDSVLMLEPGSTRIDSTGIRILEPDGDHAPLAALGDGFQATLAWVVDLMGWSMLHDPSALHSQLRGVVLLDEIEQHLHPKWQRHIMQRLSRQFPEVQFLATTHSPICLGGLADLEPDAAIAFRLASEADKGVQIGEIPILAGWRYDQLVTSEAFGLTSSRDVSTEILLEQVRQIHAEPDSPERDEKLNQAMEALRQRSIHAAEDETDRRLQRDVQEALHEVREILKQDPAQ